MTTTIVPTDDSHLELFSLIWLDANVNVMNSRDIQQKLRSIINHIKIFQDKQECQQYIEQKSKQDRLVLIVSGRLGREIVPSIHQFRQVSSIYVYCMDKKSHEQWARQFAKIKAVVVELDELVSRIEADHKMQMKVEEPLPIDVFITNGGKSTTGINGHFVFSQLLIDCLLRMKSNEMDRNELISLCMNEYEDNQRELNNLGEFQKKYASNQVLSWYTRDSFFYKTLNSALRSQKIHMIFLYRSFITDIYRQLQQHQYQHPVRVYRGQLMSIDELESLKQYIGQYISVNSFFSTSHDSDTALFFLGDLTTPVIGLERVLFEIYADPRMANVKPFADISTHSCFTGEAEVLFMLGSIFRLNDISCGDNHVWIIRMTLCSDDEHDLKQVLVHMKNQNGSEETDLRTLSKMLSKMGKFDLAEFYYCRLLNEHPSIDPSLSNLFNDLADIYSQQCDYDMSVRWHQKSFEIEDQFSSNDNANASINIPLNATWSPIGITLAGGNEGGNGFNQLCLPHGLFVDDDQTLYIADHCNDRIMEWKCGATSGQVVVGGNQKGNRIDQLDQPTSVIVDKQTNSLIICDRGNRRVVRWPRQGGRCGETIISGIHCWGLAMDKDGFLYVSDTKKCEVRRWRVGEKKGTVVAGGNQKGHRLDQFESPRQIFVDRDHSVYVADRDNYRVVKWMKGAKKGTVVAGGHGDGTALTQCRPNGVIVDQLGTVYVADWGNDRIMRWPKGAIDGQIIADGNHQGNRSNQLVFPKDLSFDRQGNLYVVDLGNHRVQRFSIDTRF